MNYSLSSCAIISPCPVRDATREGRKRSLGKKKSFLISSSCNGPRNGRVISDEAVKRKREGNVALVKKYFFRVYKACIRRRASCIRAINKSCSLRAIMSNETREKISRFLITRVDNFLIKYIKLEKTRFLLDFPNWLEIYPLYIQCFQPLFLFPSSTTNFQQRELE